MNGPRNQFLSCARVSVDEHRRVRRSDRFHLLQYTPQRSTFPDDLREVHFAADFIFKVELFLRELVFQLSNLPKGASILHGNRNLICDLGQKLDVVAGERIVLIFEHTECPQHAASADKRKNADRSNFDLRGTSQSQPPRLLDAAAPESAAAKERSRDIIFNGDKALLLDGLVFERKVQSIDPQARVVAI